MFNRNDMDSFQIRLEDCLKKFIINFFEKPELKLRFPNKLLRQDVMDLLDTFCTVVYFPIENETNNGFHITDMPFLNGSKSHFVFINTAQSLDKQNFTAAHELGHINEVDNYVIEQLALSDTEEIREMIINRFAATLLMPEESFVQLFCIEYEKRNESNGAISVTNLLKVIVNLMNHFFTPYKAVVNRLFELGILSEKDKTFLLDDKSVFKDKIDSIIEEYVIKCGYIKLLKPARPRKWIEGLPALLNEAEKKDSVSPEKIAYIRNLFELSSTASTKIDEMVSLSTCEGNDTI